MIASGIKGIITAEDLISDDFSSQSFLPTLKLELARLEFTRKNQVQKKPNEFNTLPLPPGPLAGLSFTRNLILERAIQRCLTKSDTISTTMETQTAACTELMNHSSSSNIVSIKPKLINKSTQTKAPRATNVESKEKDLSPYLLKKQKLQAAAAQNSSSSSKYFIY
jgi:hypothetical protein